MRHIDEIIVHCADTRPEWMLKSPVQRKITEIRRWHVEGNGWSDIGYHFVIDRDGSVGVGRPLDKQGAHVKGHNATSIGICLIGGHGSSAVDKFEEHFTPAQDKALRAKIDELKAQFPSITKVTGHNDYTSAKACPGFKVKEWMTGKTPSVASSTTVQASAIQIAGGLGGGIGALGTLEGTAQIIALAIAGIVILSAVWIMRERIKKWASGVR